MADTARSSKRLRLASKSSERTARPTLQRGMVPYRLSALLVLAVLAGQTVGFAQLWHARLA